MFPNAVSGAKLSGLVGVCSFVLHKGSLIYAHKLHHITAALMLILACRLAPVPPQINALQLASGEALELPVRGKASHCHGRFNRLLDANL